MADWEKVITREISLLHDDYCNKAYIDIKNIIGFDFEKCLLINKNGVIERYLDKEKNNEFHKTLLKIIDRGEEEEIFIKAYGLDEEMNCWADQTLKNDFIGVDSAGLSNMFCSFNDRYVEYWAYFLLVYYFGQAIENKTYSDKIEKYKKIILKLRGEDSFRFNVEKIFFEKLIKEISKRFNIEADKLWWSLPSEINKILSDDFRIEGVSGRNEYYVWLYENNSESYYFNHKKAKIIADKELGGKKIYKVSISELKGHMASPGIVTGNVKIVKSFNDLKKVKRDDILVAAMTDPRYLNAMEKASAFITDEGGITCHAAIIAREMKKPCVVGAKIATEILKDNDLVKVDANKGIVKIKK